MKFFSTAVPLLLAACVLRGQVFLEDEASEHSGTSVTVQVDEAAAPGTAALVAAALGCFGLLALKRKRLAVLPLLGVAAAALAALQSTSDREGDYTLSPPDGSCFAPGQDRMHFTRDGDPPQSRTVTLSAQGPSEVRLADVTLRPVRICSVFPDDNPWNTDISGRRSSRFGCLIEYRADADLHPDFGTFWEGAPDRHSVRRGPGDAAALPVKFHYADESDPGPYPIPPDAPIEGGPTAWRPAHPDRRPRRLRALRAVRRAHPSAAAAWTAGSGAIFDLRFQSLRPRAGRRPTPPDCRSSRAWCATTRSSSGRDPPRAALHVRRTRAPTSTRRRISPAIHRPGSAADGHARAAARPPSTSARFPAQVRVVLRALKTLRDGRRRQRLRLVHLWRPRPALGRRQTRAAEAGPRQRVRGRRHGADPGAHELGARLCAGASRWSWRLLNFSAAVCAPVPGRTLGGPPGPEVQGCRSRCRLCRQRTAGRAAARPCRGVRGLRQSLHEAAVHRLLVDPAVSFEDLPELACFVIDNLTGSFCRSGSTSAVEVAPVQRCQQGRSSPSWTRHAHEGPPGWPG